MLPAISVLAETKVLTPSRAPHIPPRHVPGKRHDVMVFIEIHHILLAKTASCN